MKTKQMNSAINTDGLPQDMLSVTSNNKGKLNGCHDEHSGNMSVVNFVNGTTNGSTDPTNVPQINDITLPQEKTASQNSTFLSGWGETRNLITRGGEGVLPKLKGRHILVIDDIISETRQEYWMGVGKAGVRVHIILSSPHPMLEPMMESITLLPGLFNSCPERECLPQILKIVANQQIQLSACLTFNDKFPFLVSLICESLKSSPYLSLIDDANQSTTVSKGMQPVHGPPSSNGTEDFTYSLPHDPSVATHMCQSKEAVYAHLLSSPTTAKYVPNGTGLVHSVDDVKRFLQQFPLPVVIKPNAGHGGFGVRLLHTEGECIEHFNALSTVLKDNTDADMLSCKDTNICINEYVTGDYLVANLIVHDGKLAGWNIAGNGPLSPPDLIPTVLFWPSALGDAVDEEVARGSFECCKQVGLRNGVYDVEMIRATDGTRLTLVEINPRVTCSTVSYQMNGIGGPSLLHTALGLAAGMKPTWLPQCIGASDHSEEDHTMQDNEQTNGEKVRENGINGRAGHGVMLEYFIHHCRHSITGASLSLYRAACEKGENCAIDVSSSITDLNSYILTMQGDDWKGAKRAAIAVMEASECIVTKGGQSLLECFQLPE